MVRMVRANASGPIRTVETVVRLLSELDQTHLCAFVFNVQRELIGCEVGAGNLDVVASTQTY